VAAIDGASADDLTRPREAYFGSIASNLLHTLNVQRLWLARWKGRTGRSPGDLDYFYFVIERP
jgi:uncharacterized damage-inducible protein DinB